MKTLSAAILFLACLALSAKGYEQKICQLVSGKEYEGAILRFDGPTSWEWIPTEDDIAPMEAVLAKYVQSAQQVKGTKIPSHLNEYIRYYSGVVRNGQRLLYVHFAHNSDEHVKNGMWRKTPFSVKGGGDNYFLVTYDIKERRFVELVVNAPK